MSKVILTSDGDTVSNILYHYFQRDDDELEDALFELNDHLPALLAETATLPANVQIILPEQVAVKETTVVNIWD